MNDSVHLFESVSGTRLDAGIEFVEIVHKLLHATQGDPSALDELGDLLTNDVGSERVRAVVDDALKLRLRQFSRRLDERFKGSQWLRLFLTPVGQLPYDALEWSWNHPTPSTLEASEGLRFTLGGPLGHGALVGRTAENDLQYRFDILLGCAGRLGTPFRFRNSAADRPRAQLEYRFEHPSQVLLQDALANDLPRLAHALEPEQLPHSNLKSIELDVRGQVLLGASRCTATSWSTLRDAAGEALEAPRCISSQVRFELEWAYPGHFKLHIRTDVLHGTVIATLVCVDGAEPARILTLGANPATRGLERVVRPLLAKHGHAPADLIDLADRFSRPRELMQDHLEQTLNERPALAQELRGALLASNPMRNTTQSFIERVSMDAVALLDEREALWHELLKGERTSAVAFVLARLDIADELQRSARAVLQRWIGHASEKLKRSLCEELEEVIEEEAACARALGGAPEKQDDSQRARQLLGPCVDLIARVRRARQQILDAAEAGIAEELGLELGRAVQRNRDENVLLELTLDPRHEAARNVYEQILMGDFREALALALDPGQPHIVLDRGLLADVLSREHAAGLCFDIIDSGSLDFLEGEFLVEHQVGATIRISHEANPACDDKASSIDMPAPLGLSERTTLPLAIALHRRRWPLRPAEVQQHLQVLESAGLLAAGTTSATAVFLGRAKDGCAEDPEQLRVDVLCSLSRQELARACARDRRDVERVSIEEQIRVVDACLPHLRPTLMLLDDHRGGDGVAFVQSQIGVSPHRIRRTLDGEASSFSGSARLRPLTELVHTLATNA
ncbi:MAG: hypothetical protein V3U43_04600, partial [Pseudomonadales bacterium]